MRLNFTAPARTGGTHDVVVDLEPTVTVGELALALQMDPAQLVPGTHPESELSETGILAGTVLPRAQQEKLPVGTVRLELVGGPFSGETVAMPAGSTITVGSAPEMLLQLVDPSVDAHHATLTLAKDNAGSERMSPGVASALPTMTVEAVSETAPVIVNGVPLEEPREVGPEDIVQIGASLFRIGLEPASDADVSPEGLGHTAFNRASRIRPAVVQPVVKLPGEKPTDAERAPMPWLSAVIPVLMGVGMAWAFQRPMMLMMAAASPLMVIGSYLTSRKLAKRSGKRTVDKWRDEVVESRESIARFSNQQRARAWRASLDPVAVTDIATAPSARLWERRIDDADALSVRIGVGDLDLDVKFEGARARAGGVPITVGVSPSPVTVDLTQGVVGVAGPRVVTSSIARAMLTQLVVSRSPRDLRVALLCEENARADWEWMRWLPHADGGPYSLALIGNTSETRQARVRELSALLESRQQAKQASSRVEYDSHTVVFIDQARSYRTMPGMVSLLEHGPEHGIYIVALDDDRSRLPEESKTEIVVDPVDVTLGQLSSVSNPCPRVLFDGMTVAQAETIARALAPIIHVGGAGDDNLLPQAVRFVDLLELDLDSPAPIMQSWMFKPRETRAVVGAGNEGEFALDLAKDGPHGLVAGTTGAGKSEFLQTFVVSLALANRPDALNFVLVDYKGGSAFADCERLPHTVGLVTNLDGRETERALESLDAELKRREHVLKEMGAKDADAAWEKDAAQASSRGLARLVLVIDEFAELKAELPDFVSGLVRIARVGRSLGVHLILATQRPSGAITPEMQSNTNLRVALRVTDKADSTDILGSGEAALISASTPGRGYARRGAGVAPSGFQTARVAGRRPGVVHHSASAPKVLARSWRELGAPVSFPKAPAPTGPVDHDDTDLRAIVNVITEATNQLGIAKNPSPWLDPLPQLLSIEQVQGSGRAGTIVLGLEDVPKDQAQRALEWDIQSQSHISFVGGARSGRTSTLRTMIAQLARAYSPSDLHLYGVDYGNAALTPMAALPHCGAVITPMEAGRLNRFIARLTAEIGRRQSVLAQGAYGDIREQRAAAGVASRLPYIAVVVDGWERLISDLGQDEVMAFREQMIKILREGPATGVRLVIAGDRALLLDKVSGFIDTRYIFPMTDRQDYGNAGLQVKGLPAEIKPGRVFFGIPMREVQMVLLPGESSGEGQSQAFKQIIDEVARMSPLDPAGPAASRPFRVDVLPSRITLAGALALPLAFGSSDRATTVAIGGDELSRFTVDLIHNPGFVVAGDRRAGRSTVLALIAEQLSAVTRGLIVVTPRDSPLREAAERLGILMFTGTEVESSAFVEVARAARDAASEAGQEQIIVIADDVEALKDSQIETALLDNKTSFAFCVAIHHEEMTGAFKGLFVEAKKGRQGLFVSASAATHGTQAFGVQLPRQFQGTATPGRAALFRDGGYIQVQIPLPNE